MSTVRIYLAGTTVSNPERERKIQKLFISGHKLHSYYHKDLLEKNWLSINMKNKVDLFLDSGAFSAFTQNQVIKIEDYISFIKENKEYINQYSNLDVIGDAAGTWNNQMIMESAGLNPIPVFHYGEDFKWLKRILSKNYTYISLGGMVPISTKDLYTWLDYVWTLFLIDSEGIPKCKVHGFGLTSLPLMLRYPWYSVDSTSWVVTGRMGGVYIPQNKNGKWIYDENSWKISVSNKSPNLKEAGQHFSTLSPVNQKIILKYLEEKGYVIGKSEYKMVAGDYLLKENEKWVDKKPKNSKDQRKVEIIIEAGISNTYQLRDELNIIYFLDLEKNLPQWPWAFKKVSSKSFF